MKNLIAFLLIISISSFAQNDECIVISGSIMDAGSKEVLSNSEIEVWRGSNQLSSIRVDQSGNYKLRFKANEFKGLELRAVCRDQLLDRKDWIYNKSAKIQLNSLYVGKPVIKKDLYLTLVRPNELNIDSLINNAKHLNQSMIYGVVQDMSTSRPITQGIVEISGSDGSHDKMKIGAEGKYFFQLERGVIYQLWASSDIEIENEDQVYRYVYFNSPKEIIDSTRVGMVNKVNLSLEQICTSGFGDARIVFPLGKIDLVKESKLKLNGWLTYVNEGYKLILHPSPEWFDGSHMFDSRSSKIIEHAKQKGYKTKDIVKGNIAWDGVFSNKERVAILVDLPDFKFPEKLDSLSYYSLSRKERKVLKWYLSSVRLSVFKPYRQSNRMLIKGKVFDLYRNQGKSNAKVSLYKYGELLESTTTNSKGNYEFSVEKKNNYEVKFDSIVEYLNLINASDCLSDTVHDFLWLNPNKVPIQSVVAGFVRDRFTNKIISEGNVVMTCSDGSSSSYKLDSLGTYFFNMADEVTCQLQASSEITKQNSFGVELLKYFASEKELTTTHNNYGRRNIDLFLEPIGTCGIEFPILKFTAYDTVLNNKNKLRMNGLVLILNENPSLTIELYWLENSENAKEMHFNKLQQELVATYLKSKRVNGKRIRISDRKKPLIITKNMYYNNGFYPELDVGMVITNKLFNSFNEYTKKYIRSFFEGMRIRVASTTFRDH